MAFEPKLLNPRLQLFRALAIQNKFTEAAEALRQYENGSRRVVEAKTYPDFFDDLARLVAGD